MLLIRPLCSFFFFFNDRATTGIYTLSLHDALPIYRTSRLPCRVIRPARCVSPESNCLGTMRDAARDRKSTRLNSSHVAISYAVFCLKKKKITEDTHVHQFIHSLQPSTTSTY